MSNSILLNNFRYRLIKTFTDKLSDIAEGFYFFYGNPFAWDDEASPDILTISALQEAKTKSNILALKKVNERDVVLGIEKHVWVSGTHYAQFSNTTDLTEVGVYYILTSGNRVYKCLSNNTLLNDMGYPIEAVSTIEPTHDEGINSPTGDGYIWHYMYTLSNAMNRKFNGGDYIPVDILSDVVQARIAAAVPGTINRIDIATPGGGSQYEIYCPDADNIPTPLPGIPLFIDGDGDEVSSGRIAITSITAQGAINISEPEFGVRGVVDLKYPTNTTTGAFYMVDVGDNDYVRGGDYGWSPIMLRQVTSETQASATEYEFAYGVARIDENQNISAIRILDAGKGYTLGEAEVIQSSAIAYAIPNTNSKKLYKTVVVTSGRNFNTASVIIISDSSVYGTPATLTPSISPISGHGSNPEVELNALTLIFNVRIAYENLGGDFTIENDFRSVGIIENVMEQDNDGTNHRLSSALTLSAKTDLVCKADVDQNVITQDIELVGMLSGARGKVIDVVDGNVIRIIRSIGDTNAVPFLPDELLSTGDGLSANDEAAEIESIRLPEYVPYSGQILFINNREAIQRSADQIETFNFIFKL